MFDRRHVAEKLQDLLRTENDRQLPGSFGGRDNLVEVPLPTERDFVEKTNSGYAAGDLSKWRAN